MLELINNKQNLFEADVVKSGERDGTEIEKGVVLTEEYLLKHFESLGNLLSIFTAYPDLYLDIIKPADSTFDLFFYQRITLRAIMRFKDIFITAPRRIVS